MGCGGSSFPTDPQQFLDAKVEPKYEQYLDRGSMSEDSVLKFTYKKDAQLLTDPYQVMTDDGKTVATVKTTQGGRVHLINKEGSLVAVLVVSVRDSEVNGTDATFTHPHIYVYTFKPYKEGQKASEYVEDGKALYHWCRMDKQTKVGQPKFACHMAEVRGSGHQNIEMFGAGKYNAQMDKDGRIWFKTLEGKGACLADLVGSDYKMSVSPGIDPLLMICLVSCAGIIHIRGQ